MTLLTMERTATEEIRLPEPVLVSVVVPTRDRPELLAEALASIRALEGTDLRFEILVGDNGNNPKTVEVVERFGARRLMTTTQGAAASRNVAMRAATGEYIAFLDDDDVWLPAHVRPHLLALQARPDFAAAVGQIANTAEDLMSRGPFWPEELPDDGYLFGSFLEAYPQIGATVVRASVRDTVGYFDEELLNDQDWDWHLRLALRHRVAFVPVHSVLFRQRELGVDDALQWRRLGFLRKVFIQNVRRAGRQQRPSWSTIARNYLHHVGHYEDYFARSGRAHIARGERREGLKQLWHGVLASPPHAGRDLLRPSDFRWALVHAFLRTPRRSAGAQV